MGKNTVSYIFAITCVVLWGFSFVWADFLISSGVGILAYITERMIVAAAVLWLVGSLMKSVQKISRKDLGWMFLLGFSEPFVYFIGENYGIKHTSGVIAALMIALVPVFCLFAERIFFKAPLTFKRMFGVLITLPGILMVVFQRGGETGGTKLIGILLLLMAVTASCSYIMFTKKMTEKYSAYTIVTWQFTFGAILFLPLFLLFGREGISDNYFTLPIQSTILALALLCSCVCFGMWAYITGALGVTRTSIFSALIPLATAIVAFILYPELESFSWLKVAGILVSVLGVILVQIDPASARKKG